jgi:plasmid stabilization system protein ParE
MKVIIRESAYDDLDRIYAWMIAKDRPRAADAVLDLIPKSADRLGGRGGAKS